MKKIEKVESIYDLLDLNLQNIDADKLKDKINELIDALNELQGEEIATSGYVETVGTPILGSTTTTSNSDEEKSYHIPNMRCKTDAFKPEGLAEKLHRQIDEFLEHHTELPNDEYILMARSDYDRMMIEEKPEEFTLEELEEIQLWGEAVESESNGFDLIVGNCKFGKILSIKTLSKLSKMIQEYE